MTTDPDAALPEAIAPLEPRPRVLVVEDEAELAQMLAGLLTEEGYAVDVALDGHSGLHDGLTRHYDVVVLEPVLWGTGQTSRRSPTKHSLPGGGGPTAPR